MAPYLTMWAAVINQSALDIRACDKITRRIEKGAKLKDPDRYGNALRYKSEAENWLNSTGGLDSVNSYRALCDHLQIDPGKNRPGLLSGKPLDLRATGAGLKRNPQRRKAA